MANQTGLRYSSGLTSRHLGNSKNKKDLVRTSSSTDVIKAYQ
jgi:hypothetical protein